jgi:hypothetical protein
MSVTGDIISAILILIVVAIFASVTGDIYIDPLDPGFSAQDFPLAILTMLTCLSLFLLSRSVHMLIRENLILYDAEQTLETLRFFIPMIALGILYILLIYMFQYPVPTLIATTGALALFGNSGVSRLVIAPIVATLVYYVTFYGILGLYEEPGAIWSYSNQWYFRPLRNALGLF